MFSILPLLLVVCLLPCSLCVRTVMAKNQTSVLVAEGGKIRLSCGTEDKVWFFCLWHSPSKDKQCAIQYAEPANVCRENNRTRLIGGMNYCDVEIEEVHKEDHGMWMCLVHDNETFHSVKEFVRVEVGVLADIGLSIQGGDTYREGILRITEGEEASLRCWADDGYPEASFWWSRPHRKTDRLKDGSLMDEIEASVDWFNISQTVSTPGQAHTTSSYQTAKYTAEIEDHNTSIICRVEQGGDSRQMLLLLHVQAPVFPSPLVRSTPLLSSILLLALIFLLLSCVLLTLLIVRSKRRKGEKEHSGRSPSSPLVPHIVKSPNGVVGAERTYHEYQNHLSEYQDYQSAPSTSFRMKRNTSQKSLSASDLSSNEASSHTITVLRSDPILDPDPDQDNPFAAISAIPSSTLAMYQYPGTQDNLAGSVPILSLTRRRSSIPAPARVLINPTTRQQSLQYSVQHPLSAKSLCQLSSNSGSTRRRRKTAPAHSKSSHSVFDCEEGCFEVEQDLKRSQQIVRITTGPLII